MKLLFASSNKYKTIEIRSLLPDLEIVNLIDVGCYEDIPETADSFIGNARIKAEYGLNNYELPCFSDDSGLEIQALNNEPGVFSARYAGDIKNDQENIDKVLSKMKHKTNRKACFKTVIVLKLNGLEYAFEGLINGEITTEKKGINGFGYDSIFIPMGYTNTFAEMSIDEKSSMSHRGIAVQKMVSFLNSLKS